MPHEPDFWYSEDKNKELNPLSKIALDAAAFLRQKAGEIRNDLTKTQKVSVPVICVGNLVAGGSGKTPTAIYLCRKLKELGICQTPFFLSRGYGGKAPKGTVIDNVMNFNAKMVGDEPLLLARYAPVVIDPNRYHGALKAIELGSDLLIMDDGLQNPTLFKDINIVLVNSKKGFGNRKLIPAGPLREPLKQGLSKASLIITTGTDADEQHPDFLSFPTNIPLFQAAIAPDKEFSPDKEKDYIGFCGIANPENFRATLKNLGLNVIEFRTFEDHYNFTLNDLEKLRKQGERMNATLITTEKDLVRIKHLDALPDVITVPVFLAPKDEESMMKEISELIPSMTTGQDPNL